MKSLSRALLLLRWSWRDLRARWPQVLAIALVIALGTGSFAGLSSVTRWRRASTNDARAELHMHDLRLRVAQGSLVPQGALLQATKSIPNAGEIAAAEERIALDIQVDASREGSTVLVPGRLFGLNTRSGGPAVDQLFAAAGRSLNSADTGEMRVALERNFAKHYELPAQGRLSIAGGQTVDYVGQVFTPEYFLVTTERGGLLAEANFAAVFTSMETAQAILATGPRVNELVLTLQPGSDPSQVAAQIGDAIARELPGTGVSIEPRSEDPSYRLSEQDIKGDQELYSIFAILILGGAVVAAFNLVARIVEAQRREIGIAMVLGLPPWRIALRPLLVAAEIALLGVVLGVVVGVVVGDAMASFVKGVMPLPRWQTPFQLGVYARVAALGFALPFVATLWPVWRAVSVPPIRAIRAGYRASRGDGLAPLFRRMGFGGTFAQMPVRNLVRAPRRTLLTGLGVTAAIAVLVVFVGLIDSFSETVTRGEDEIQRGNDERLEVELSGIQRVDSQPIAAIRGLPLVAGSDPVLRLSGTVRQATREVSVRIDLLDFENEVWTPAVSVGRVDRSRAGIYLSELAARDLDVSVGDFVMLEHPVMTAGRSIAMAETDVPVLGLHPHPFRFVAYMDSRTATLFGMSGLTNLLQVQLRPGIAVDDAKSELFAMPGVASTISVGELVQSFRDLLEEFVGILRVVEAIVLVLALLIAFNAASINADERAREHATMFAFGVRVRTVIRLAMVENLLLGLLATGAGILAGRALLGWIVRSRVSRTFPDIDMVPRIAPSTLALAAVLGVLAVSAAPLLTWRRLRRMDLPSALKVAE